ncbi:MAG: ribonuclease III, partial [Smithellaceae bacterium]|nr:ribonuclease III [Smithellaceae bacterium]
MDETRISALRELEGKLGYRFRDINLLDHALVHRSYVNENPAAADNERLEFLGDAVLELCISDLLIKRFPDYAEGKLSKLRASLVKEAPLAELADNLQLGDYILLGKGEATSGGRKKRAVLANSMEAIIAALYIDGGFGQVHSLVNKLFAPLIGEEGGSIAHQDYKTSLQELSHSSF